MISRQIHQLWVGPKAIPEREKQWCDELQKMNCSTWNYRFHGNEVLERYGTDPYLKHLLGSNVEWAFVSDRIRCLLLRDHGGVWLDTDCRPIVPLDTLKIWDMAHVSFAYGFRSPDRPGVALHRGIALVDNHFLASGPRSRMIERLLQTWTPSEPKVNGHRIGTQILRYTDYDCAALHYRYFHDMQTGPETIVLHDPNNLGSWVEDPRKPPTVKHGEVLVL